MSAGFQRVCLVQGEAQSAKELEDRLGRLGYEVCGAACGNGDPTATIAAHRPDIVLMEASLAGETDGVDTAARLRGRIDVPVVLMTAEADRARVSQAGEPFDCLVRPFGERELDATIQLALAKHQARKAAKLEAEAAVRARMAQLEASETRFAAFARIGADWLWETDTQDRFTYLSTSPKRTSGPNPRLGRTRREGASPETDNLARLEELEKVIAQREPFQNFIYRARVGDTGQHWCMISGEPIYDPAGAFVGYRGVGRDVENEIETRRALESKTRILDAALAATPDGVSVTSVDRRAVEWNDRLFELFGVEQAAALVHGDPIEYGLLEMARRGEYGEGDPAELVLERRNRVAAVMAENGSLQYERRLKTGRWIEARLRAMEGGGWVSLYRDVTERKRTELALRELNASLERRVDERTRALAESERFSRGILDSIGAQVAVLAADGRIVATNSAWRDLTAACDPDWQRSSEGANYLDICEAATGDSAEDARTIAAAIRDVIVGRRDGFQLEYPCHRPGKQRWFLCRVVRLDAVAHQVVVSHHDVTAAHLAWERAAAGERTFASLAAVSPVGIFRTGADGGILEVNKRWCEITGMTPEEALGEGWVSAVHPADRERIFDEWMTFARGGSRFRGECRFIHLDGNVHWVVGEAMQIDGARDGGVGYIGTITDITEQKQIELALRALSADLASLDGARYFEAAARRLAALLDAPMAHITRLDAARPGRLYTVAAIEDGKTVPNFSYPIAGTPCAEVLQGRTIIVSSDVQARYPEDDFFVEKDIDTYAGVPILDPSGHVLGTVHVLGRKPFREAVAVETTLKMFGVAIGAALTRERNRRQYEELFEFAPRALVMMEQDGSIALANRQAERIFGWTRQEMIGRPIEILVPGGLRDHDGRLRQGLIAPDAPETSGRGRTALDCRRKDGALFSAEIDLAPVSTETGILIAAAVEDITARKAIETALATSRNNLADALESIDRGVILYDKDDRVVISNSRFREHFPGPAEAIKVGARFEDIFRAAIDRGAIILPETVDKEKFIRERVARHRRPDGQVMTRKLGDGRILHVTEHAARNGGIIGIGADVTEQLKIEEQLRAIQKMEAIGQLTGGMAHDFNNYLGVIVGNLDMLKECKSDDPVASQYVNAALDGALRGAELTQSLLAFSRRKRLDPRFTDLNTRVDSITKLLSRTLGEKIRITVAPAPNLWPVEVDAAQLDSCIVNIATNARDAMPDGGVLKIATRNEVLGDDYVRLNAGVTPGPYALIEISDSGVGMSAATLERAFEPFFTTKPAGHGTGLGLSMVYGFVKQSGGHIKIGSEPGHGTTVRIYLPKATTAGVVEYAAPAVVAYATGGTGTILVVEDNEQLRATAVAQLKSLGYRVLQAQDGQTALDVLAEPGRRVDLLFSDVMMPGGLDGYALAQLAAERYPGLKVLLTSGFPGEALTRIGSEGKGFRLIGKPYRKEELERAIRQVLAS